MPLLSQPRRLEGGALLDRLHAIQKAHGFLSPETLKEAAGDLNVPLTQLYSAATFYSAFRFQPKGRHTVRVCMGTACHIRGGEKLLEKLESDLGVKSRETTADGEFTLETVRCVGSCSMSPVIQIDGDTRGRLRPDRLTGILDRYLSAEETQPATEGDEG